MGDFALLILAFIIGALTLGAVILLAALIVRRRRRKPKVNYLRELQERGVVLLFSDDVDSVVSGLQLLLRFGVPASSAAVISRVADLTSHSDDNASTLATRLLQRCGRDLPRTLDGV